MIAGASTFIAVVITLSPANHAPPRAALRYKHDLIRVARYVWGLKAPIAVSAGQIQQESSWNPNAKSKFADGLAQFTPQTAKWISGLYHDLKKAQPYNPKWAMLALVRYDKRLYDQFKGVPDCDRWAFALASYNGGLGWIHRDQKLTSEKGGDPNRWWGNVALHSSRASWAFTENRGYPKRILKHLQFSYWDWGNGTCKGFRTANR